MFGLLWHPHWGACHHGITYGCAVISTLALRPVPREWDRPRYSHRSTQPTPTWTGLLNNSSCAPLTLGTPNLRTLTMVILVRHKLTMYLLAGPRRGAYAERPRRCTLFRLLDGDTAATCLCRPAWLCCQCTGAPTLPPTPQGCLTSRPSALLSRLTTLRQQLCVRRCGRPSPRSVPRTCISSMPRSTVPYARSLPRCSRPDDWPMTASVPRLGSEPQLSSLGNCMLPRAGHGLLLPIAFCKSGVPPRPFTRPPGSCVSKAGRSRNTLFRSSWHRQKLLLSNRTSAPSTRSSAPCPGHHANSSLDFATLRADCSPKLLKHKPWWTRADSPTHYTLIFSLAPA